MHPGERSPPQGRGSGPHKSLARKQNSFTLGLQIRFHKSFMILRWISSRGGTTPPIKMRGEVPPPQTLARKQNSFIHLDTDPISHIFCEIALTFLHWDDHSPHHNARGSAPPPKHWLGNKTLLYTLFYLSDFTNIL